MSKRNIKSESKPKHSTLQAEDIESADDEEQIIKSESATKSKQTAALQQQAVDSDLESVDENSKDVKKEISLSVYMQSFCMWFPGRGVLKEIEIDGKMVSLYDWIGVTSRGQKGLVQLWRQHAGVFSSFVE